MALKGSSDRVAQRDSRGVAHGLRADERYRAAFDAIAEGFCLVEVEFDEHGAPADLIVLDVNAARDAIDGLGALVGKRIRGVLPDADANWIARFGAVARTGQPVHFDACCEGNRRCYEVNASRVGGPGSTLVAIVHTDVTARKQDEQRQSLLAGIARDLAAMVTLPATLAGVAETVARFFGVKACLMAELVPGPETLVATYGWSAGHSRVLQGAQRLQDFLEEKNLGMPLSNRTVIINDVADEPRSDHYAALGIRSLVLVPMPRDGRWRYQLTVLDDRPRTWSVDEQKLLHEIAERIWARVASAHAEEALREGEARQAFLLQVSDALHVQSDPRAIKMIAARLLARRLAVDRVMYSEANGAAEPREFVSSVPSESDGVAGHAPPLPLLAPRLAPWLPRDEPFVVSDVSRHPGLTDVERAQLEAANVRALIVLVLVKAGEVALHCAVHHSTPRSWSSDDITVVREIAERTWNAAERARTESRLREREDQLSRVNERLEQRVATRTTQIERLFSRLIESQENERLRFARDLHDQLGQQMTALRMHLEALQAMAGRDRAIAEQTAHVQQVAAELDESIDFLTWQLRPAALDEFGLSAALHNLVTSWSDRFGIAAAFERSGDDPRDLGADAEMNLYRIAQEALHNIVRHAAATRVAVRLQRDPEVLLLEIQDNGRGFDLRVQDGLGVGALGLVSMRERATLAGGRLEIESRPGKGTAIIVRVFRDRTALGRH